MKRFFYDYKEPRGIIKIGNLSVEVLVTETFE